VIVRRRQGGASTAYVSAELQDAALRIRRPGQTSAAVSQIRCAARWSGTAARIAAIARWRRRADTMKLPSPRQIRRIGNSGNL